LGRVFRSTPSAPTSLSASLDDAQRTSPWLSRRDLNFIGGISGPVTTKWPLTQRMVSVGEKKKPRGEAGLKYD
jgi:hypothetical protein